MDSKNLTGQLTVEPQPHFRGHYSEVYQGIYQDKKIAVKVFKALNKVPSTVIRQKIRRELERLARLDHPNIQGFYGFAKDDIFSPYGALISAWRSSVCVSQVLSEQGDQWTIQKRIETQPQVKIQTKMVLLQWKDVISGVHYLHSQNPAVIHGDIEPGRFILNILGKAVLCEPGLLGISFAEGSYDTTARIDTNDVRYLAPELINKSRNAYPTTAADIYALGCLGFEFTFDKMVHSANEGDSFGSSDEDFSTKRLPAEEPDEIDCSALTPWKIIQTCWLFDPTKRPSTLRLIEELYPRGVQLPHDVLFLIFTVTADMPPPFDHLAHLEGDHWGPLREAHSDELLDALRTLARLSLVSKSWHGTAVPLLYQRMRIRTQKLIAKAVATLEYRHHNPCPWIGSPHGAYVRTLDVGNRRERSPEVQSTEVIADLHCLVVYTPNLRSYHTSTWISSRSKVSNFYSSRIVPNLLKNGRNLTTLEISDQKFALTDMNLLVNGLPSLDRFIVSGLLLWELQLSRKPTTSTSLKTLVIVEPDGASGWSICLYSHIFSAIATWNIPNLHTVLIHDCCSVTQVLGNIASFLSAHQSKVRQIIFRRWVTVFSENDVLLLTLKFSEFPNTHSTQNSVRFWKD